MQINPQLYNILTYGFTQDLPAYQRLAHQFGGPILDIGAGLGRISLPLLEDGHSIVTIDNNPAMCSELSHSCSHLLEDVQRNIWVLEADATTTPSLQMTPLHFGERERLPTKFATILIGLRTVHLIDPEKREALFSWCHQHLHKEGILIIHHSSFDATKSSDIWRLVAEHPTEQGLLEIDELFRFNPQRDRFELRHRIYQSNEMGQHIASWRVAHDLYAIDLIDIQQSLAESGFSSVKTEPLYGNDQLLIVHP